MPSTHPHCLPSLPAPTLPPEASSTPGPVGPWPTPPLGLGLPPPHTRLSEEGQWERFSPGCLPLLGWGADMLDSQLLTDALFAEGMN